VSNRIPFTAEKLAAFAVMQSQKRHLQRHLQLQVQLQLAMTLSLLLGGKTTPVRCKNRAENAQNVWKRVPNTAEKHAGYAENSNFLLQACQGEFLQAWQGYAQSD